MNYKVFSFLLISINLFYTAYSQSTFNLEGSVLDSGGRGIPSAHILVFSQGELIDHSVTNDDGKFILELQKNNFAYLVRISALGFETLEDNILDEHQIGTKIKKEYSLQFSVENLKEVIVQTDSLIRIRNDTIFFKADKYKSTDVIVVEDLLEKLPGVQVGEDGTITVNGKEIKKILIEGNDVFDLKYKIPSKNIDSRDISEVEIIYNFQENEVLRDFTDSEDLAINLKFKTDRRNRIYGNGEVGIGLPERYQGSLTLFKLNNESSLFYIGDGNNIGNFSRELIGENFAHRLPSDFTIDRSHNLVKPLQNIPNDFLDEKNYLDNQSFFSSINIFNVIDNQTSLRIIGNYANDFFTRSSALVEEYNDPGMTRYHQSNKSLVENENLIIEGMYKYENKKNIFAEFKNYFSLREEKIVLDLIQNKESYQDNFQAEDIIFLSTLKSSYRIGTNQAVDFQTYFLHEKLPTTYLISDNSKLPVHYQQHYTNRVQSFGIKFNLLTENGNYLIGYNKNENNLISGSNERENQQNDLLHIRDLLFLKKGWVFDFSSNIKFSADIKIGYQNLVVQNKLSNTNSYFNHLTLKPSLELVKHTKSFGKFTFLYTYDTELPDVVDYFSNPVRIDRNTLISGTETTTKLYKHRVSVTHSKSNFLKQVFYTSNLSYATRINSFGYIYSLEGFLNHSKKIVVDGNQLLTGAFQVDKVIPRLKSGISLKATFISQFNQFSFNSDDLQEFENRHLTFDVSYGTYFRRGVNFKAGFRGRKTRIEAPFVTKSTFFSSSFVNFKWELKQKFSLDIFTSQVFRHRGISDNNVYFLASIKANYIISKNKSSLFLGVENLKNQKEYREIFLSSTSKVERRIVLLPTYIYLKFRYRF